MADRFSTMTPDELRKEKARTEAFITEACTTMRGPLSNLERALTHADRRDAREHLARIEQLLAV